MIGMSSKEYRGKHSPGRGGCGEGWLQYSGSAWKCAAFWRFIGGRRALYPSRVGSSFIYLSDWQLPIIICSVSLYRSMLEEIGLIFCSLTGSSLANLQG